MMQWTILAVVLLLGLTACGKSADKSESPSSSAAGAAEPTASPLQWSKAPELTIDKTKAYHAVIETNKGSFTVELFAKDAPETVNSFVFLAEQHYFDGVPFHRIIESFMIQTGDPTGTGSGGPGYTLPDELNNGHSYEPGIVAMANAGPNTGGSQFFICTGDDSLNLNGPKYANYTIFGKVTEGMDVVKALAATPVATNPLSGESSAPTEEVKINTVTVQPAK